MKACTKDEKTTIINYFRSSGGEIGCTMTSDHQVLEQIELYSILSKGKINKLVNVSNLENQEILINVCY